MKTSNDQTIDLQEVLHARIREECLPLLKNQHFKHAAFEAMKQVELALAARADAAKKDSYGGRLIDVAFGKTGKVAKLTVPLGDDRQKDAKELFKGAFSYYRNYTAHDGEKINRLIAIRIMVIASELLDLISASSRSLDSFGGLEALIQPRFFKSARRLVEALSFLDDRSYLDVAPEDFLEGMAENGLTEELFELLSDLGLIDWSSYLGPGFERPGRMDSDLELYTRFELTEDGKKLLLQADRRAKSERIPNGN